jgi:hypothetical protein
MLAFGPVFVHFRSANSHSFPNAIRHAVRVERMHADLFHGDVQVDLPSATDTQPQRAFGCFSRFDFSVERHALGVNRLRSRRVQLNGDKIDGILAVPRCGGP